MSADLRVLRDQPFELLTALEARLRDARHDLLAGQEQTWTGLGFRIGDTWLVAPREDVREVIPPPPSPTRVPNAKPWLRGLANVRGELLTLVDLRALLDLPAATDARSQKLLVLNSKRVPAGFIVDEVGGYRQFAAAEQRRELGNAGPFAPFLLGGFVREGQAWLALSLHKLSLDERFTHAAA